MITNPLRKARLLSGLTQCEVAQKLGINQITVSRYETGNRQMRVSMAKKFAVLYDVPWTSLYEDDEKTTIGS